MNGAQNFRDRLPSPVRRYLDLALPERPSAQVPASLVFSQNGTLRTSTSSSRWLPFSATHEVRPLANEFSWTASVRLAPFIHLSVRDSFRLGQGVGEVRLGWLRLGHDAGSPQINSGSLHRFLAEAVFYPWALLPSSALKWTPIDESRALATLTVGATEVSLEFRFEPGGQVGSVYTPARWGRFDRAYRQVPWQGHFAEYSRRCGAFVPSYGEVGWREGETLEFVWRGHVTSMRVGEPFSSR